MTKQFDPTAAPQPSVPVQNTDPKEPISPVDAKACRHCGEAIRRFEGLWVHARSYGPYGGWCYAGSELNTYYRVEPEPQMGEQGESEWEELRKLAEAGTRGRWEHKVNDCTHSILEPVAETVYGRAIALVQQKTERSHNNAAFIAAASPDRILELIGQLKAMTEDRNLWRGEHNQDCPNLAMYERQESELADRNTLLSALAPTVRNRDVEKAGVSELWTKILNEMPEGK